jgi:hypothetical protein
MAENYDRIVVRAPQPVYRASVAAPRIFAGSFRMADAGDVVMEEAADGALLAWNGGSQKFEAKMALRNQTVDGGNF